MSEGLLMGLPGPSHFFGGLSPGNIASLAHAGQRSHPRAAAQQCVTLMRQVVALGRPVLLLPPLPRPDFNFLAACGFSGELREVVIRAHIEAPRLLQMAWSSAAMWTANLGTVAPGTDSDGITRLVLANCAATAHRSREAELRLPQLQALFATVPRLRIEAAIPGLVALGDEGAANHTRLCVAAAPGYAGPATGVHLFVHGTAAGLSPERLPQHFPARQTLAASMAVARRLDIPAPLCLHARQHPSAIDAGAFHHDVIGVGDGHRLLLHQHALVDQDRVLLQLRMLVPGLEIAEISAEELSLTEAVGSYLFNSLLLGDCLVAPQQCRTGKPAAVIERLLARGFIRQVDFVAVDESMANGGGPACLRLRLPLDTQQWAAVPAGMRMDPAQLDVLAAWIDRHYRSDVTLEDLADSDLPGEHACALADLSHLLALPENSCPS